MAFYWKTDAEIHLVHPIEQSHPTSYCTFFVLVYKYHRCFGSFNFKTLIAAFWKVNSSPRLPARLIGLGMICIQFFRSRTKRIVASLWVGILSWLNHISLLAWNVEFTINRCSIIATVRWWLSNFRSFGILLSCYHRFAGTPALENKMESRYVYWSDVSCIPLAIGDRSLETVQLFLPDCHFFER